MSHHLVTLCRSRLFLFVFYIGNLKVNSSWGSRQKYTHKRQSFLCDMIRYILKDAIFWINPDLHDQLQLFNGLSYFFCCYSHFISFVSRLINWENCIFSSSKNTLACHARALKSPKHTTIFCKFVFHFIFIYYKLLTIIVPYWHSIGKCFGFFP